MAQTVVEMTKTLAPEDYEKLLHHSWLITSEAHQKMLFFKGVDLRVSSTLIFLDLLKNWGHPCTMANYDGKKKARAANNLLLLEADSSWKNQSIIKHEDKVFKSFEDFGAHATHVSDLLVFRSSFFSKYDYSNLKDLCYDIGIDLEVTEYWHQVSRNQL